MITFVPFKGGKIRVKDEGRGPEVMLLHGYLESLDIWDGFADRLAHNHRVVRIDIPGHGQSDAVAEVHTMSLMAEAVETVWQNLNISRCVLVGHSMGGYVSLACMAEYPDRLAGVCLFHSSPFADSDAKKASRAKEIRLVQAGKLMLICNTSIPNGFADENLQSMADKIEFAKEIARRTSPEGAAAILEGMRNRPDRTELLTKNQLPLLFILGKQDNYVSFDELYRAIQSFPNTIIHVLEHSGHSGYFEEPEKSTEYLSAFLEKCRKG